MALRLGEPGTLGQAQVGGPWGSSLHQIVKDGHPLEEQTRGMPQFLRHPPVRPWGRARIGPVDPLNLGL
eukprot:14631671-Alexandrium_andersonii.AAC.1